MQNKAKEHFTKYLKEKYRERLTIVLLKQDAMEI